MKQRFLPLFFLSLSVMAATGAARHRDSPDRSISSIIAQAPFEAREKRNPFEGQPDAVLAGEKLFRHHCAGCHGEDAQGKGRAVNLRSHAVQDALPGELVWFLRNGNLAAGMPSWSGLPEPRRWQIVTYLKSLR
jgi:mono/diheme cytochrome c family protein